MPFHSHSHTLATDSLHSLAKFEWFLFGPMSQFMKFKCVCYFQLKSSPNIHRNELNWSDFSYLNNSFGIVFCARQFGRSFFFVGCENSAKSAFFRNMVQVFMFFVICCKSSSGDKIIGNSLLLVCRLQPLIAWKTSENSSPIECITCIINRIE